MRPEGTGLAAPPRRRPPADARPSSPRWPPSRSSTTPATGPTRCSPTASCRAACSTSTTRPAATSPTSCGSTPTTRRSCTPTTSSAEGFAKGDIIEIDSGHAQILGVVEPAPDVARGVISMAHSWGDAPKFDSDVRTIGSNTGRLSSIDRDYDPITGLPGHERHPGERPPLRREPGRWRRAARPGPCREQRHRRHRRSQGSPRDAKHCEQVDRPGWSRMRKNWWKWALGGVVALVVLIVGGSWFYIKVIEGDSGQAALVRGPRQLRRPRPARTARPPPATTDGVDGATTATSTSAGTPGRDRRHLERRQHVAGRLPRQGDPVRPVDRGVGRTNSVTGDLTHQRHAVERRRVHRRHDHGEERLEPARRPVQRPHHEHVAVPDRRRSS